MADGMTMKDTPTPTPPAGYADWLASLKTRIHHARQRAALAVNLSVPLVVRMKGTNEELGKQMLADSGLPIIAADTMADAARQVVAAAAGK